MRRAAALLFLGALVGCAAGERPVAAPSAPAPLRAGLDASPDPYPSTYRPGPSQRLAIVGATVLTGTGAEIANGTVLLADGRIEAVGAGLPVPDGYQRIDGAGRWVTPGVIDAHSHVGIWSQPDSVEAHNDVNELTEPNTAEVWAEHSVWPQDPGFDTAREAGITTLQILPGSGNLFGGRTVTLRNVPAMSVQEMKFPGAPYGLKVACGENPKRVYGGRGRSPASGMGNVAGYRRAWIDAADYRRRWDSWRASGTGDPPRRDLELETLAGVLGGEILVQNHCYRADEMAIMIDVAREFGFRIRTFHHANEAYKIAPLLAREDICVATWTNWWGYKMEVFDAIEENAALVHEAGGCAIIHSDDPTVIQHLNQEAAAALSAGRRAGLDIDEAEAIRWITANPARALGISETTGTLEPGKRADVVLWSANPFSIYARAERVWIDGASVFDRRDPGYRRHSDFLVGQPGQELRP
ncbi:amidohydrolase [Sphingosinicella sp. LHD-64]|uniref:amidohydrolase n=1 Tax=Sphingosinicella sp. LHD-64 TaxID=3072139 RepID=UPI00280F90B9|nr:amidohydrolase [Sphingosinicella sp. LHD-64]MDQ8754966.1 amidohydrolase [Sphingosinicella sp. LHD-64]